ncbi:hypothetical protein Ddye_019801 [Dipteronia dyeriana]|uniref:Uncharacterized protein n=1 Tax=Dipteronia dyeriana TaxID=168575 RepID=A0AAD9TYM8_9ROSI|nr:hypothetical protein Ddye_019801 [Dipteronia dyeriana]
MRMPIWCTLLVHETLSFVVPLYTIDEGARTNAPSISVEGTGWSKHFLSKRKYHVIIPIDGDWNRPWRNITVEDVSKMKCMDLRLLHGVAYGHPWFGRWGYRFSRGNFGVTELNYN